jgi:hypothetical protein
MYDYFSTEKRNLILADLGRTDGRLSTADWLAALKQLQEDVSVSGSQIPLPTLGEYLIQYRGGGYGEDFFYKSELDGLTFSEGLATEGFFFWDRKFTYAYEPLTHEGSTELAQSQAPIRATVTAYVAGIGRNGEWIEVTLEGYQDVPYESYTGGNCYATRPVMEVLSMKLSKPESIVQVSGMGYEKLLHGLIDQLNTHLVDLQSNCDELKVAVDAWKNWEKLVTTLQGPRHSRKK